MKLGKEAGGALKNSIARNKHVTEKLAEVVADLNKDAKDIENEEIIPKVYSKVCEQKFGGSNIKDLEEMHKKCQKLS